MFKSDQEQGYFEGRQDESDLGRAQLKVGKKIFVGVLAQAQPQLSQQNSGLKAHSLDSFKAQSWASDRKALSEGEISTAHLEIGPKEVSKGKLVGYRRFYRPK